VSPLKMPIRSSLGLYLLSSPRVFESDVKGSTGSSSSAQRENSSSYIDELMYSFFANQSSGPQLDHEDLEQLDAFDLEEMDLKWQVAIISMRLNNFTRRQVEGCSLMPRNQFALTRPKLSASIATKQGTLLENADQKEIKKAEGEMQGTLDMEQKTMGGDLENRRNIKLW
ncbi:hypothetical protein Tco_1536210, partial [Tanacetum coccineum]